MTDDNDRDNGRTAVSRRATLTLAAGVAAFGVALGMRSSAHAQGKGEGKLDAKGEGKGDGKFEGKAEGKAEGKGEGKFEGKEWRLDSKAGRIKVDIDSDGTTSVDIRCADGQPMQACADVTKDIIDKIKASK